MMRTSYGEALVKLGRKNQNIVVLDADLAHATFTDFFKKEFPDRHFNVGIAESNMIDMSVGFSLKGYIPICSTFALFGAGRAYEMIRNTVAYSKANVKICCTHGGLTVGPDGGSHESIEDFALMRVLPGMVVIVPGDANEVVKAIEAAVSYVGPVYMRIGRSPSRVLKEQDFIIGKANILQNGTDIAIISCGIMVPEALEAAEKLTNEGISTAVINMHTIKPIDEKCISEFANKCGKIVTIEEHSVIGGLGDAVGDVILTKAPARLLKIGVQDEFGQSGDPEELLAEYGLKAFQIAEKIKKWI